MSSEDFVERGLRSLGFDVRRIEEGEKKKPDFLVSDSHHRYLVEVKDKFPDPKKLRRRKEALFRGQVYDEHEPAGYRNVVSYVIREAADQLAAFSHEPVDFRIVWLHARGRHLEVQRDQFKATLYGSVEIVDLDDMAGTVTSRPCFYFGFSEFFNLRDVLDGAFISTDREGLFCLNALSPRYFALKGSALCGAFYPGICDPVEKEREGEAYVADCDMSRKDKAAVLRYLKGKYGRSKLLDLNMVHYSAEVVVPRPVQAT